MHGRDFDDGDAEVIPEWSRRWQAVLFDNGWMVPGYAPKHKGISALLVDMDTPGIDVRPLRHITGATDFAEVFFTDVSVPVRNLVGVENDGWRITMGSLAHERGGLWVQSVALVQQA